MMTGRLYFSWLAGWVVGVGLLASCGAYAQKPAEDDYADEGREAARNIYENTEKAEKLGLIKKIVGGKRAPDNAFPWQVGLIKSTSANPYSGEFCGGSLVADEWVLTAAHCVKRRSEKDFYVIAGTNVLGKGGVRQEIMEIFYPKQDYNEVTFDYDVALLRLKVPLPLGPGIQPIRLMEPVEEGRIPPGTFLTVSGWGATVEDGDAVAVLQFVKIPLVRAEKSPSDKFAPYCNDLLSYDGQVTERMLCAGAPGKDSCQGDSGGPLVADLDGVAVQIGIVSWGKGCARPQKYGVYSRVSKLREWIDKTKNQK
jgi:secreted trypsin-like serine protease